MKRSRELLNYIKLKRELSSLESKYRLEKKVKNPYEKLLFPGAEVLNPSKHLNLRFLKSYRFWFILISVSLFLSSIVYNQLKQTRTRRLSVSDPINKFVFDQLNKPYVITIGNFNSYMSAKEKAIELLPKLKKIEIIKLSTGNFTFKIEKLSSKQKAYEVSKELTQDGFPDVHVRYLPVQ